VVRWVYGQKTATIFRQTKIGSLDEESTVGATTGVWTGSVNQELFLENAGRGGSNSEGEKLPRKLRLN
jgi:hypothetical protein